MIITIFGATGIVGKHLVKQALIMGHQVRAFGRNVYTADFREHEHLTLVPGALFDESQVSRALHGADAVLSAIGGPSFGMDKTRSLGMKNIATQMINTGVSRIVAIGSMGILDDPGEGNGLMMDLADYPEKQKETDLDHYKAFTFLSASGLDWTMVCPPEIKNADPTGLYKTAVDFAPAINNPYINAGDLSLFMLNEVEKDLFIRKRVAIWNT